jgi:hypothetical protein
MVQQSDRLIEAAVIDVFAGRDGIPPSEDAGQDEDAGQTKQPPMNRNNAQMGVISWMSRIVCPASSASSDLTSKLRPTEP